MQKIKRGGKIRTVQGAETSSSGFNQDLLSKARQGSYVTYACLGKTQVQTEESQQQTSFWGGLHVVGHSTLLWFEESHGDFTMLSIGTASSPIAISLVTGNAAK